MGGHQLDEKLAQTLAQDRRVLMDVPGVLTHAPQKLLRMQHAGLSACAPEAGAYTRPLFSSA